MNGWTLLQFSVPAYIGILPPRYKMNSWTYHLVNGSLPNLRPNPYIWSVWMKLSLLWCIIGLLLSSLSCNLAISISIIYLLLSHNISLSSTSFPMIWRYECIEYDCRVKIAILSSSVLRIYLKIQHFI